MQQNDTIKQVQTVQTVDSVHPTLVNVAPLRHEPTVTYTEVPAILLQPVDSIADADTASDGYLLLCNDSLFAPYADRPVQYRESMFAGNGHSTAVPSPTPHHFDPVSGWVFGVIVLLFAIMSFFLNSHKFKFRDIFLSLFAHRVQERMFRESNLKPRSLLPMTGIYLASLSLIALRSVSQFGNISYWGSPLQLFLVVLASLSAFIALKNGFIQLLGNIFNDREISSMYIACNYLFYFVGAVVTLPLALLLYYYGGNTDTLMKITLVIIAIIFIVRVLRVIQLILTNTKNSKLYLFYYLCILEIAPILVIIKVLIF